MSTTSVYLIDGQRDVWDDEAQFEEENGILFVYHEGDPEYPIAMYNSLHWQSVEVDDPSDEEDDDFLSF